MNYTTRTIHSFTKYNTEAEAVDEAVKLDEYYTSRNNVVLSWDVKESQSKSGKTVYSTTITLADY